MAGVQRIRANEERIAEINQEMPKLKQARVDGEQSVIAQREALRSVKDV
jgi:hypothetical protein